MSSPTFSPKKNKNPSVFISKSLSNSDVMIIKKVPISKINVWEKNPRHINTKDFERLKKQIQELGVYKPLICIQENGKYIVLGGNMRFRALKALGIKDVEISIVEAKTEAMMIKYALSDNDRAGSYIEQDLAELVYPYIEEINLEDFKVELVEPWIDLAMVIERFGSDIDPISEWTGMPEFKGVQKGIKTIFVHFEKESDIRKFEKIIEQKIGEKTKYIWFPKKENESTKSMVFDNES